ncbi:unnamed protein product [Rhizophagus irregularis]|nr:unnamed protein product [Rhizophagus irregularis]
MYNSVDVMYHGLSPEHLYLFFACNNKNFLGKNRSLGNDQLPYDPKLAKFYSQDKLEYCLTCNTSSNKLKFAIDCANSKDSTAYKELEGALLRQNCFEKWHIFRGWKHGCKLIPRSILQII